MKGGDDQFMVRKAKETTKVAAAATRTTVLAVRVPRPLLKSLKVFAAQNEMSLARVVNEILEKEMRDKGTL